MARNKRVRHTGITVTDQSSARSTRSDPPERSVFAVDTIEKVSPRHRPWLNDGEVADNPNHEPDLPSEMVQGVWEALKEEFYEQIEQLPLSLHRSFALIGEQDKEVEVCRTELLPIIRSFVKLRQSLHLNPLETDLQEVGEISVPPLCVPDAETKNANPYGSVAVVEKQPPDVTPEDETEVHGVPQSQHKREDTVICDMPLQHSASTSAFSVATNASPIPSEHSNFRLPDLTSQSMSTRTLGLRESDASVPKSAPFPPRPKPKTTRDLLPRISFLMSEGIRASEEKVGLATAAYDSIDRHLRVLDTAIKEYQASGAPGIRDNTYPVGIAGENITESSLIADVDDELQLGMMSSSAILGDVPRRRSKKRELQDRRQQHLTGNSTVNGLPPPNHGAPIDPSEPRYCYCHQVSYGEMIACDNPDCRREWFHLGCAELSAPPKGKIKWYCRECEQALGRRRRIR